MLKRKQIVAFMMAAAMSMQMASPAFAASSVSTTENTETTETATTPTEEPDETQPTETVEATEDTETSATTTETVETAETVESNQGSETADSETAESVTETETETEEQAVKVLAEGDYTYTTVTDVQTAIADADIKATITLTTDGSAISAISITDATAFIVLSHTEPSLYDSADISLSYSGSGLDLTATLNGASFIGLGSESSPFKGTLSGKGWSLIIKHALFNGLDASATLPSAGFTLTWKGACEADAVMLASTVTGTASPAWNVTISSTAKDADSERIFPALFDKVAVDNSTLSVGVTYGSDQVGDKSIKAATTGTTHAGLICNELASGSLTITSMKNMPSSIAITAGTDGYAGGLVGSMTENTKLTLSEAITMPSGVTITGAAGAGGIVGQAAGRNTITLNGAVTPNGAITATGTNVDAGGFIGSAKDLTLTLSGSSAAITVGSNTTVTGTNVGGLIGDYSANVSTAWQTIDGSYHINNVKLNSNATSGNAGGLFGLLTLGSENAANDFTIAAGASNTVESTLSAAETNTNYGGLIGSVNGLSSTNLSSVNINGATSAKINVSSDVTPAYVGGLVGAAAQAYIAVAMTTTGTATSGTETVGAVVFGGAVGYVADGSVLDISSLTVEATYKAGGGAAGAVGAGAAVRLNGTLGLTKAIPSGERAAQIIGTQTSGLIFATNEAASTLKRCPASRYNDIGNYGEVIRLGAGTDTAGLSSDLITIDMTSHKISLKSGVLDSVSSETITLNNVNQFALLAIMIQSEGKFSSAVTVTRDDLLKKNITLGADIDLTGTGIIGLMRDVAANAANDANGPNGSAAAYSGTLDGDGHTLTLAVGEAWGTRDGVTVASETEGSGQIYARAYTYAVSANANATVSCHNRIGLFSNVKGATVQNITLAGTAFVGADQSSDNLLFGGITATANNTFTVGDDTALITDVTTRLNVSINGSKDAYVGGLIGVVDSDTTGVTFNQTAGNAVLTNTNTDSSNGIRLGGLIGRLSTGKVTVDKGTTLGGKITSNTTDKARVGGLIADTPSDAAARTIKVNDLTVDGQTIHVNASAETGGLLGYEWHNTNVYFADQADATTKGLTVKRITAQDTSLTNTGAGAFGGLVYRANGYWQVNKIAMEKAAFTANSSTLTSGLLVCRGEDSGSRALYLELTSDKAYTIASAGVTISTSGTSFDELVAYTASSASDIVANGNGIISIATAETNGTRDLIDTAAVATNCNTYQNVTKNSKTSSQWAVNPCSRYYYNLDKYRRENENALVNSADVNSPERLLLWSAGRYAANNIKTYFGGYDSTKTYKITGALAMSGYSYYPVSLSEADHVSVDGAAITFDNATIEVAEELTTDGTVDTVRRVTSGTASAHSQHYLMHCGLFYNFAYNGTPTSSKTYTLKVNNTTFSGSVGMRENTETSGALLCGNVGGKVGLNCYATMAVTITDVTLTDLYINKVNGTTAYAPLLMNTVGSYTSIAVSGVIADNRTDNAYTENTTSGNGVVNKYAATSLIGRVGGSSAVNMAVSFDKIKLEGKKADSIFKNATLLEWFQYDANKANSGGTYNFNLADDWTESTKEHTPFNVTYGWEISNSVENKDQQHWYYDQQSTDKIYVNPDDYPSTGKYTFTDEYLTYVADSVAVNLIQTDYHELKVNIPVADLLEGCGTYSDPYVITNVGELEAVANYLRDKTITSGWQINIDENIKQDLCDKSTGHVCYVAGASEWVSQDDAKVKKNVDDVREYLRNAYYQLGDEGNTALTFGKNFIGLGTSDYAFRGVIIGYSANDTQRTMVTIGSDSTATGLINYSYGSVVKRLTIAYEGARTVTADGFGGVINHIMGGDNIIDNVTVTGSINQTSSGDIHLRGVGGYVGIVEGGGVIFRSMTDANGWAELGAGTNAANFYQNPFVGRVLDGFAFYEQVNKTGTVATLENTDKNYTIVTLDMSQTGDVVATFSKDSYPEKTQRQGSVEVKSQQGLLILSAIAASGAAAGGTNTPEFYGTLAYYGVTKGIYGNGDYGKTRNATYDEIGTPTATDVNVAIVDDTVTPCPPTTKYDAVNKPYLVSHYTDNSGYAMLFSAPYTRFSLTMDNGVTYNMNNYGNGYRGIGGRYASNAVGEVSANGKKTYNADRYTPYILGIDCGGAVLNVNQTVKEYDDDNYPATAVGGLMPFLQQDNVKYDGVDKTIKDLTVSGSVSLKYFDKTGNEVTKDKINVGVGGVFGRSANRSVNRDQDYSSAISNIKLDDLSVEGPKYAGGLFGAIGINGKYASPDVQHTRNDENKFAVTLKNCTYENLSVTSQVYAGGFIGYSGADGKNDTQANVGINTISTTNNAYANVGSTSGSGTSVITAMSAGGYAGGLIGYSEIGLVVDSTATSPLTMNGVTVQTGNTTGNTTGTSYSGALVGRELGNAKYAGWNRSVSINNVNVSGCTIGLKTGPTGGTATVGGLLGSVEAVGVTVTSSEISSNTITGTTSGGLLGELLNVAGTLKGSNLLWTDNIITGSTTAGNWVGIGTGRTIQLAGVSRQATTDDTKTAVLENDIGDTSYADETTGYIAYADYTGTNNDTTETVQVTDDAYSTTNTFEGIPVNNASSLNLGVGEKAVIGGTGYVFNSSIIRSEEKDGNTVITALNAGTTTDGGKTITVVAVGNETIVQTVDGIPYYYGNGNTTGIAITTNSSYCKYQNAYLQSSTGKLTSGGSTNLLYVPVEKGSKYKISFTTKPNSDSADSHTRFRVALFNSSSFPAIGATPYNSQYYISRYDKDYSDTNLLKFNTTNINDITTIYASFDGNYKAGNRFTDANETSATSSNNTITFIETGYAVIAYNDAYSLANDPYKGLTGITVTKIAEGTSAQSYDKIAIDSASTPKTNYVVGDTTLDKAGLIVWGKNTDTDGYVQLNASQYSLSTASGTMDTAGAGDSKQVTVTLNSNVSPTGTTVSTTYPIAVNVLISENRFAVNVIKSPMADDAIKLYTLPTLTEADGTTQTTLYGDGIVWDDSSKLMINQILSDGTASPYLYTNQKGTNNTSFDTKDLSTFSDSNKTSTDNMPADIPLLKVSGGNSDAGSMIGNYLDTVTNGGYSHAVTQSAVTASATTYKWNGDSFTANETASVSVSGSGTSSISYQTGSRFDNDQLQLTVLAVTFSAGTSPTYTVYVPIVVERILEVDVMATFQNGTTFYPVTYNNTALQHGVLDSHGSAITAYVTYTYNSQKGTTVPYGWQSYIDGGGDVSTPFEKTISFGTGADALFPTGTEFLLVDCQNNDKMYSYTAASAISSIALGTFTDDSGAYFSSQTIGEMMNAEATVDNSGKYVQTQSDATVVIGGQGYKIAGTGDEELQKYTIRIDENTTPTENYYLVIRTPEGATDKVLGAYTAEISCSMPKEINHVVRADGRSLSGTSNSERTFSIYSGYKQDLTDSVQEISYTAFSSQASCTIPMRLQDTITYTGDYRSYDRLYQKFQVDLAQYTGSSKTGTESFPAGVNGTVTFNVTGTVGDMQTYFYYVADESEGKWIATKQQATDGKVSGSYESCPVGSQTWTTETGTVTITPLSYVWTSDGGTMNLIVGTGNSATDAVSLSPVRDKVNSSGNLKVSAEMDIQMSAAQAQAVIPTAVAENNTPEQYVKLHFTSQLSSTADSLSYSTQSATNEGNTGYYLTTASNTSLSFDASDIMQLGINVASLDEGETTSTINAKAVYTMTSVEDLDNTLAKATAIRFRLTAERRDTEDRDVYNHVTTGTSLWQSVTVGTAGKGSTTAQTDNNTWVYDLPKNDVNAAKVFDGYDPQTKTLTMPVTFVVDTTLKSFANYHAKLEVSLIIGDQEELVAEDYITYTLTNINPEFIENMQQ